MPKEYVHTEVEGRKLKLTNLTKILYPVTQITKAQVIEYYLTVAPYLLDYIKNRPLTVIRYPDGIKAASFYSKEKPEWTPTWIANAIIAHEEKSIEYVVATEIASIVWLANLACLELHPTQFRTEHGQCPDVMIVDLDPDPTMEFSAVKEAALRLRDFFIKKDYNPFIKTSGGKGLHLHIPIQPNYPYEIVSTSIKGLAKLFIQQYPGFYTLDISKEKRKGKILIDIYRNHLSNTTVAPFSLRGKENAPISMPIRWEDIDSLDSAQQFTLSNYQEYLNTYGNVWSEWRNNSVELHDQKIQHALATNNIDERLISYTEKRKFDSTTEPFPRVDISSKNKFCVQIHEATNLHYDLRLEDEGVLWSWAIPKGLPYELNTKRLAIRTEDHPVKYLQFEGIIPKNEYGAGTMWLFDIGDVEWNKKTAGSLEFKLSGEKYANNYKLYRLKNDEWLIELTEKDNPIPVKIPHMLAEASRQVPTFDNLQYEVKWDGIRVMIYLDDDRIKILSRNGNDLTAKFPELHSLKPFKMQQAIIDAEIVVLDESGRPKFDEVISRMHLSGEKSIVSASKNKTVSCYIFDLLMLDGIDIMHVPLLKRRQWLEVNLKTSSLYRFSESFDDGAALFEAIKQRNMEGIMAKNQVSEYKPGARSRNWLKVKCRTIELAHIIGYTKGNGDRSAYFGALHLAKKQKIGWQYMGKVGSGFDHERLKKIHDMLSKVNKSIKIIKAKVEEEKSTSWIEPLYLCEIEYASLSVNGTYREPVFLSIKKAE